MKTINVHQAVAVGAGHEFIYLRNHVAGVVDCRTGNIH